LPYRLEAAERGKEQMGKIREKHIIPDDIHETIEHKGLDGIAHRDIERRAYEKAHDDEKDRDKHDIG